MDRLNCEELRAATLGCEVVLLVATDVEAALLTLRDASASVATKRFWWAGTLRPRRRLGRREPRSRRARRAQDGG